jgi:hypothetical protein
MGVQFYRRSGSCFRPSVNQPNVTQTSPAPDFLSCHYSIVAHTTEHDFILLCYLPKYVAVYMLFSCCPICLHILLPIPLIHCKYPSKYAPVSHISALRIAKS